jgi:catechol 2,3-dioxygenase-like lactoylglutathione lyase family enzyme
MPSYELYAVRIFVSDWKRSLDFYTRTLGMTVRFANEELGWAELALGRAALALERAQPGDPESHGLLGRFVGVSLRVDDVAATYAELGARGVEFVGPPEKQPWGGTLAHFRDPDGNALTLFGRS